MSGDILREVVEEASAITSSLSENIQGIAFAKVFDALLRQRGIETPSRPRRTTTRAAQTGRPGTGIRSGASHRAGPKLALGRLIDSGYFASRRDLPNIQRYLRDSYGYDYGSNVLSISLLRLIRDGRLSRQKNSSGQYEYCVDEASADSVNRRRTKARTPLLTDGRAINK
jgi:hypothetical protein